MAAYNYTQSTDPYHTAGEQAPARRILVVEATHASHVAVAPVLGGEGDLVEVVGSRSDALRMTRSWGPDLIVVNEDGPDADGLGLLRCIRLDGVDTPVILVTSRTSESHRVLAFHLGVDDYLLRPVSRIELLARANRRLLHSLRPLRQSGPTRAPAQRFGAVEVDATRRVVLRHGREVALTPKAFDLLSALLQGNGAVVTREQLLQDVWGHKGPVSTRTVDLHIFELRQKLEERSAEPRHIVTVRKVGYRLDR